MIPKEILERFLRSYRERDKKYRFFKRVVREHIGEERFKEIMNDANKRWQQESK